MMTNFQTRFSRNGRNVTCSTLALGASIQPIQIVRDNLYCKLVSFCHCYCYKISSHVVLRHLAVNIHHKIVTETQHCTTRGMLKC